LAGAFSGINVGESAVRVSGMAQKKRQIAPLAAAISIVCLTEEAQCFCGPCKHQ
jgi:hypothetical protein